MIKLGFPALRPGPSAGPAGTPARLPDMRPCFKRLRCGPSARAGAPPRPGRASGGAPARPPARPVHRLAACLAAAALLLAGAPAPARQPPLAWQAEPGREIVLGTYYEARHDPRTGDCAALRAPSVQIVQAPRQGSLTVRRSGPAAIGDEPRCLRLRAPVAQVVYRAAADARGEEEVSWRVFYQSGQLGSRVFRGRVTVRP